MTDYEKVTDLVTMTDVLNRYCGISATHRGNISCPLHDDTTASFSYSNNKTYYCFGCGSKGNVISFVSSLFGISSYQAMLKLDRDFCLNIKSSTHNEPTADEVARDKKRTDEKLVRAYKENLIEEVNKEYIKTMNRIEELEEELAKPRSDIDDKMIENIREFNLLSVKAEQLLEIIQEYEFLRRK